MLRIVCTSTNPEKAGTTHHLLSEKTYSVGRKIGDITFPDDTSISRTHAELLVEHPGGNITEPMLIPTLSIIDLGSKFGTYATEENIRRKVTANAREKITLNIGDKFRFGLQWNEFKVEYTPFILTTSSFKATQEFKDKIQKLGGHIESEWKMHVTHLVMEEITLTVKAVCALLAAKPIVTPAYVSDLLSAFEAGKKTLPDPNAFLPKNKERTINNVQESAFHPNSARTTLFAGKTFLFLNRAHMKKMIAAAEAGGGSGKLLTDALRDNVATSEFIIMGTQPDVEKAEKNSSVGPVISMYKRAGKRFIADSEMGLAAVHCSIEKFCNPSYDLQAAARGLPHIVTQTQSSGSVSGDSSRLAPETQDQSSELSDADVSRKVVDETVVNEGKSGDEGDNKVVDINGGLSTSSNKRKIDSEENPSKKRSAGEDLPGPDSKRVKESSSSLAHSSSRQTRSAAKTAEKSKVLASFFNLSDSDEEDDELTAVPETQPSLENMEVEEESRVERVPDSQPEPVTAVDVSNLKSSSRSEDVPTKDDEDDVFVVPASPTPTPAVKDGDPVRNPGTDFVETVRMSVMNAKTIPIDAKPRETSARAWTNCSRTSSAGSNPGEGTSSGRKRRRDQDDDEPVALAENAKKISIEEKPKPAKAEEPLQEASFAPLPVIRKKLIYEGNKSRLETTLSSNDSRSGTKRVNVKVFKKTLPTFIARALPSIGQENPKPDGSLNATSNSFRRTGFIRLCKRDYTPGPARDYPCLAPPLRLSAEEISSREEDPDTPEAFVLPFPENIDPPPTSSQARKKTNGSLNGKANAKPSTSLRTSPRKRALEQAKMPPPPPRPPQPVVEEDDDEDDIWSFNR